MVARHIKHILTFKFPAGTSRGVLYEKASSYILLNHSGTIGIGECATIPGLSTDCEQALIPKIEEICTQINNGTIPKPTEILDFPAIAFGLEAALLDVQIKQTGLLFPSDFSSGKAGIPINGLVWMGSKAAMQRQIKDKISAGYRCIKLKIGALDFETEINLISNIRKEFSENDIEIRLDANGAFNTEDALHKLDVLSKFKIHSIEQPIKQGQTENMALICRNSPIAVALDEELIGLKSDQKRELLETIKPAYVILKPSLLGGFSQSEEWIRIANDLQVKWWVTSALESNIGLNAIAQWTYTLQSDFHQGLGTGQIYNNNIPSPLEIKNATLFYNPLSGWDLSIFN